MWFNLSTMANLGVSVSESTPYVMHNFGMYSECSFVMPDQKPIFSIENKFQDLQVRRRIWELDRMSIQLCSPLWVLLSSCSSSCASSYNSLPSMIQSPNPQSKQQKTLQIFFPRARFQENRSIFNTANPRLMNVSLMKDTKSAAQARSKKQRKSMRNTSMIPDTLTNTAGGITSNSLFIRTAYSAFLIHLKY